MTEPQPPSRLLKLSILACALGIGLTLPLLIRETPYTFTAFMFVGQPLLLLAFALFAVKVFQDLRSRGLL